MGRFWVSFLSYTAAGLQLWFYFHLFLWVVSWDLQLKLPWRTWACPCEGQMWRLCSSFGCKGSGSTRYSGGCRLVQQEIKCSRRVWCQEPAWGIPPMAKVTSKRPDRQRQDQALRKPPWAFLSIYPQTRICLSYYFMTFTNVSDINRGYPQPPFSGKS